MMLDKTRTEIWATAEVGRRRGFCLKGFTGNSISFPMQEAAGIAGGARLRLSDFPRAADGFEPAAELHFAQAERLFAGKAEGGFIAAPRTEPCFIFKHSLKGSKWHAQAISLRG